MTELAATAGRPRGRTALVASIVVGIVMIALIAVLALGDPGGGRDQEQSPLLGRAAPPVVGTTLDDASFDIDEHRGQWVLVNFFATWCAPCVAEHPDLVAFDEAHADGGDVQVVSVAFQNDREDISAFFTANGGEWPVVVDGDLGSIAVAWGVTGVPESFLVSPQGVVVHRFLGGVTVEDLDAVLADARGTAA